MAYDIEFSASGTKLSYGAKYRGIWLSIRQNGVKLGELTLGKGSLSWRPVGRKRDAYYFEWKDIPKLFEDHGKPC